jgi:hypothetical protein
MCGIMWCLMLIPVGRVLGVRMLLVLIIGGCRVGCLRRRVGSWCGVGGVVSLRGGGIGLRSVGLWLMFLHDLGDDRSGIRTRCGCGHTAWDHVWVCRSDVGLEIGRCQICGSFMKCDQFWWYPLNWCLVNVEVS